jgi:nitroimidazol reductase NimA-like FMN-containing flavoprotein (pyridoxamine 5'-phosphate oxidase superfamily)
MRQLCEEETTALLTAGRVGRLGCIHKGEPYVVPINYLFEEGVIYSHSLPGMKIEAMRSFPRVCLQVDEITDDFNWRSALAFGTFEELSNAHDRNTILAKLLFHFSKLTPVESMIVQDANAPAAVVFRIVIDRVTGVAE